MSEPSFELRDDLDSLITCKVCKHKYEDPVILPCFKTICLKHVANKYVTAKFKCQLCDQEHDTPQNGFISDENMLKFITFGLNYVNIEDFGEINSQAKTACQQLESIIKKCQHVTDDYFNYIDDYFSKLRNEIDLKKEELILALEDNHERILKELKVQEEKCLAQAKIKTSKFSDLIHLSHSKVNDWSHHLEIPNFSNSYNKQWKSIIVKAEQEATKLGTLLLNYQDDLLLFKECKFNAKQIVDNNNFGDLVIVNKEINIQTNSANLNFTIDGFTTFINNYEWKESKDYCLLNNIEWRLQAHIEKTDDFSLGLSVYIRPDTDLSNDFKTGPISLEISLTIIQSAIQTLKPQIFKHKFIKPMKHRVKPIISLKEIMDPKSGIYDKQNDSITLQANFKIVE